MSDADWVQTFRQSHPDVREVEVFVSDLNGISRGKLMPVAGLEKLAAGGVRMPTSTVGLDIFSEDCVEAGKALQTGDPDGPLRPVAATLAPMLWADKPTAQVMCSLSEPDGSACGYDPRTVLESVVARAVEAGVTPVIALELEFYLIDPREASAPENPLTGGRLGGGQVYEMEILRAFEPVMAEITAAARALGAPTDGAIAEFGAGQFEVNLTHQADACAAADHVIALRRAVRGVARKHGLDATFMAKPFGDHPGSGLHVHLSLADAEGRNVLGGDGETPSPTMRHLLAGVLRHMADSTLIFAPHLNSYRRTIPGWYVPTEATWGRDHRGAAVRLPEIAGPGARIEHRVAGADANPYLVVAALIAAALDGLTNPAEPPPAISGGVNDGQGEALPGGWQRAEARFSASSFIADWMGRDFRDTFGAIKRQEYATFRPRITDVEYELYLRRV